MIYLFAIISLTANVLLVWYTRKLLQKYWFDVEAREKFTQMLSDYAEALNSLYKLEELYGEEIIKKAIVQTNFVIEACKEFKESIDTQVDNQETSEEDDENYEEDNNSNKNTVTLREGQKISQDADKYRRVVIEDI